MTNLTPPTTCEDENPAIVVVCVCVRGNRSQELRIRYQCYYDDDKNENHHHGNSRL